MELVSILQLLVQRWIFVAVGGVVAIAIGLAAAGALPFGPQGAGAARLGVAESKLLVDTHRSYTNDLTGGSEVLGSQAALLATLIADERQKESIARAVGVAADRLDVLVSEITEPQIPSTLARRLAPVVDKSRQPYAITVRADSAVPIIKLEATAPSARLAAHLARAGTAALVAVTAASAPSAARALVIKPLGRVRAIELQRSGRHGPLLGVAAVIAIFGLWCCAVVVASGLARAWRGATPTSASATLKSRESSCAAG
jgi:hypothetical protein